jgi:hypothetical protein
LLNKPFDYKNCQPISGEDPSLVTYAACGHADEISAVKYIQPLGHFSGSSIENFSTYVSVSFASGLFC